MQDLSRLRPHPEVGVCALSVRTGCTGELARGLTLGAQPAVVMRGRLAAAGARNAGTSEFSRPGGPRCRLPLAAADTSGAV